MTALTQMVIGANADNWAVYNNTGWTFYNTRESGGGAGEAWAGRWTNRYWSAFRFALPAALPSGCTIDSAVLQIRGYGTWQWDSTDYLRLYVTDSADAAAVTAVAGRPAADSGSTTLYPSAVASGVRWPASGGLTWGTSGYNSSVSLVSLIQQLVNTYGGLSSGAHVVIWTCEDATIGANTDSEVGGYFYEKGASYAAKLDISYTASGGGFSPKKRRSLGGVRAGSRSTGRS